MLECPAREVNLRKGIFEFPEDRIYGGSPSEGFGVFIVFGKIGFYGSLKLSHRAEASPPDRLGGDTSKETLYHVEPGTTRWGEVNGKVGMA